MFEIGSALIEARERREKLKGDVEEQKEKLKKKEDALKMIEERVSLLEAEEILTAIKGKRLTVEEAVRRLEGIENKKTEETINVM